ncbi:hypothetical protein L596_004733 [Steinernema carpocapsae]|uniref:Interferon-related developmental regulator N-terminal domain-containing protein n=1 Tax=Steinernema carpocapsae TaxID=34508 RepID=A0A4U8UY81_STECR|nr:hypothetical protein L596_004733 [Steinernema carpocapsae]
MGKKGGNRNKTKEGYEKPRGEAGRAAINDADLPDTASDAASEITHLTLDDDITSVIGDDNLDVEDEDEFGDSPRDRLEEFLDNATHKNPAIRTAAVKNIQVLLTKHYLYETLDKWKSSVIELIEKNIKKSDTEAMLLSTLAALLSVQMGTEIENDLNQVLATMRQLCADPSQSENVRSNCALALGICVYLSSEQPTQIADTLQVLNNVWTAVKVNSTSSNLFNAAIASWSLLADRSSNIRVVVNDYSKIVNYLDAASVDTRVSAGESLGCLYELAFSNLDSEYVFPNHDFILQKLTDLATDSVKYRAKKDRRIQRFTFRQIFEFLRSGETPSVTIKFGSEVLELESFQEKLLYDMCCKFLHGGMNSHLKHNELIRDLFDLGEVVEEINAGAKLSKQQRMIQHKDISRTRNMRRAKQRDKRSTAHAF